MAAHQHHGLPWLMVMGIGWGSVGREFTPQQEAPGNL